MLAHAGWVVYIIVHSPGQGLADNTSGEKVLEPDLFHQSKMEPGGVASVVLFRQSVQSSVFSLIAGIDNTCRNSSPEILIQISGGPRDVHFYKYFPLWFQQRWIEKHYSID